MNKESIEKLAERYQKKADKDYNNYQECGISRYLYSYHRNDELASALRIAVEAADEHQAYTALKQRLLELVQRAQRIEEVEDESSREGMTQSLLEDIIQYGRIEGLIG